jgi:hypothetical protein
MIYIVQPSQDRHGVLPVGGTKRRNLFHVTGITLRLFGIDLKVMQRLDYSRSCVSS